MALGITLTSLSSQSFSDYSVTISDQSSGDPPWMRKEIQAIVRVLEIHRHEVCLLRHVPRRGMAEQRHFLLGLAKAPYVSQFVRALLESGEQVLLFAHHHAVMDTYRQELRTFSPAFITGRETPAQKEKSVNRFMESKTNLCCISLRAASGLNLQRATVVVFGELDWSPAVHSQAEDRAHRIGQKDSLLCYYLVSPRGSDADIQERLGLKVSQFLGLMGQAAPSATEDAQSASIARQHVERLIRQWADAL